MKNKHVVITGASQGIGEYLAIYFAQKGATVILLARNEEGLQNTLRQVEEAGGTGHYCVADLSDTQSLTKAVNHIGEKFKRIDVLINNAADVTSKPFLETDLDEIEALVKTNVTGVLQLTRLLYPMLKNSKEPSIVNISSLAGYKANPMQTVYSITKTATNGISDALRWELEPEGFHVMNVGLSSVGTKDEHKPGQVSVARYAHLLESALFNRQDELFLTPANKWLMRLYKLFPALAKLKSPVHD
jgi:short-subunit dehydrogenase